MDHLLETPIVYLKGVGPKRADLLKSELNIFTFKDLIEHYPFRYVDKSKFFKISEIKGDMPSIQIEGSILSLNELGIGKSKRLVVKFSDGSSQIDLVWFKQIKWIQSSINLAKNYVVFGKPNFFIVDEGMNLWQYEFGKCIIDFFLKFNENNYSVVFIDIRATELGYSTDMTTCENELSNALNH